MNLFMLVMAPAQLANAAVDRALELGIGIGLARGRDLSYISYDNEIEPGRECCRFLGELGLRYRHGSLLAGLRGGAHVRVFEERTNALLVELGGRWTPASFLRVDMLALAGVHTFHDVGRTFLSSTTSRSRSLPAVGARLALRPGRSSNMALALFYLEDVRRRPLEVVDDGHLDTYRVGGRTMGLVFECGFTIPIVPTRVPASSPAARSLSRQPQTP